MRKFLIVALVAALGLMPAFAGSAYAQSEPSAQTAGAVNQEHRLLAAGAGAILGIFFLNILTQPTGTLPFMANPIAPNPKDIVVGSRLLAALTGGTGALVAHYLYHWTH